VLASPLTLFCQESYKKPSDGSKVTLAVRAFVLNEDGSEGEIVHDTGDQPLAYTLYAEPLLPPALDLALPKLSDGDTARIDARAPFLPEGVNSAATVRYIVTLKVCCVSRESVVRWFDY
jgi:hypothetical protein